VQKHIQLKHLEAIAEVKTKAMEEQAFQNYFNDPKRIIPSLPQNNNFSMNPMSASMRTSPNQIPRGRQFMNIGGWVPPMVVPSFYPPTTLPPQFFSPLAAPVQRGGRSGPRPSSNKRRSGGGGSSFQPPRSASPPPPPGVEADPRAIRTYVDLDNPGEQDTWNIDYRTSK